ncbi:hypothetical protein AB0305_01890 [Arthrobacter sp. NPDC080086]|uniref:hypothetical protein n=1 Tax=Arthrobacter sp. NPDC080086 TaxID=3155917 RepID=UPI00344CD355
MRLSLERLWCDPDDGMLELRLSTQNATQSVAVDFYDYAPSLTAWGARLAAFPASISDEATFERGVKGDNTNLWLAIRAFVVNDAGATALEIDYEKRGNRLNREAARFAVSVEAAVINRLGAALQSWDPTKHPPLVFGDGSLEPA